ncbi:MAG TPA: ABC transporter permease [Candidatus Paceibacterota bacterium]|nr:ABC transporter permease [Verrucomicrobiota bacterium]HRY48139.1 ABC transporter permease [Candidatus Paceibacterota bacterium]
MKTLRTDLLRLRSFWQRRGVKRETDEERRFYLGQRTAENITTGMTPKEAAREARRRFGNIQCLREECCEARGASLGGTTLQDIRFGARILAKMPGFAAITILTLALGVAGNIVIFTAYNSLYLRPFPFVEPDRLVDLNERAPRWNLETTGLSFSEFSGWRELNQSFEAMAAWEGIRHVLVHEGNAEWANGARVSHDMLAVLKIQPVLGRGFLPEEDRVGGPKVLLLSHGIWQRRFGGRTDIVGQILQLSQEAWTVVGVLPPDKGVLVPGDYWVPLAYDTGKQQGWHLSGLGRLKPGVSLALALEDLQRVHQGLVAEKRANENTSPRLTTLTDRYFGDARLLLRLLLLAVAMVLVIACGNVAALMLARGLARGRELGLRLSLGATRWRVARLIVVESLLLAALGGLIGMALGNAGLKTLLAHLPEQPPRWVSFDADWRVWLFAGLMVAGAALLGSLPVIRSALKLDLRGVVQSSGHQSTTARGGRRSLNTLVAAEMALTLVVMVQAGLLYQTFRRLQGVDPGFRSDHVLVYDIALPDTRYRSDEERKAFFKDHLERVLALPGVESASAITAAPLSGHWGNFFVAENAPPKVPGEPNPVVLKRVTFPGYFETMRIPIQAGRAFTDQDGVSEGSMAVIVNETFAKQFWPGQEAVEAVGKRIRHEGQNNPWITVIGLARDVKHYGLDQPVRPGVYIPFVQSPVPHLAFVTRSSVEPASLVPSIRALVREQDPEVPVFGVVTMEERLNQSMWSRRLAASLFGIFSAVALVMAACGIYGVFSYVVNGRRQELGVRLALGAQRGEILWLVIRQGLRLSAIGLGIGLVGAFMASAITRNLLFGVSPFEPVILAAVTLVLLCVAVLACWVPTWRAIWVNPMEALRCE